MKKTQISGGGRSGLFSMNYLIGRLANFKYISDFVS